MLVKGRTAMNRFPSRVSSGAFAATALIVILSACGQPHVDTPSTVSPKAPASAVAPNAQSGKVVGLNLTGAANDESIYAGSLVIWDDAIAPEQLTTLLDATKRFNSTSAKAQAALAAYERDVQTPRLAAVAAQTDVINALLQKDAALVNVRQQERANTWIAAEIDKAVGADETLDEDARTALKAQANTSFSKYCEAQVIEYALNPVLAKGVFTQRPSPDALCEPVYAALGFFQGDSCAPQAAGRSYYECVWKEGVALTSFYARFGAATRQNLAKAMASESGRASVAAGLDRSSTACSFSTLVTNMRGMNGKVECAEIFSNAQPGLTTIDFTMMKVVDEVEKQVFAGVRNKNLDTATPTGIIDTWHASDQRVTFCNTQQLGDFCPWPSTVTVGGVSVPTPDRVKASLQTTGKKLFSFVSRIGSCDLALFTPRDAFFNAFKLKDIASLTACAKPGDVSQYPDVFALPSPAVIAATEKKAVLVAQLYTGKNKFCTPTKPVVDCALPAFKDNWGCSIYKFTDEKLAAVNAKGVAQVVYRDFRLTVRRNTNGTRALLMSLGAGDVAGACIAPAGGTAPQTCGLTPSQADQGLAASYDDKTGRLLMTMPVRAKFFGAIFTTSDTKRFVTALEKLEGQQLTIEAYPSLMEGTFQYLSGKAVVRRGSVETAQGVASYLFDNRFEDAKRDFCAATY